MAQIIPSITSLPLDSSAAPSVEDIQDRLPSICVDYLSHDWSEEDVWASWRSMTRHKHEIANGVRLENASWRTWQKQRNKLKTISPETLNWLKDSDVTWLYGPLHTAQVEPVRPMKVSSTDDKYGLDPAYKKPILKHRTLSEMLTIHQPSSPILEATKQEEDDDSSSNSGRPPLVQTKSDTNIVRVRTGGLRHFAPDTEAPPIGQAGPDGHHSPVPDAPSSGKRHISFNTFVEQVIALDEPLVAHQEMSDSSDDDMLEMRSSSSRSSRSSSRPSMSRNSSMGSSTGEHLTIAKIAPTMLKTNGVFHSSLPAMVYAPPPEYRSPAADEASSFDFPSPQTQTARAWSGDDDDEEDFSSVGYDYYSGQQDTATPSHVVRTGSSPQATKTPPQTQPSTLHPPGQAAAPEVVPASLSSSSSSSSAQISTSPSVPGRSILKVRPPLHAPKDDTPPSPPSSTYFNYNPSAATGIGGMRSVGAYDYPGASGSPTSPGVGGAQPAAAGNTEERGRSTARGIPSTYGRSSSGSASIGSTASISPGAPRSPNELPPATKQKPAQAPSLGQVVEAPDSSSMEIDHEDYVPDRSNTPTPHSSPQIAFRPLKDTSPASLPHHSQFPSQPQPQSTNNNVPISRSNSHTSKSSSPELPKADSPRMVSPIAGRNASRATTAHVGTNAAPTIANDFEPTTDLLQRTRSNSSANGPAVQGQGHGHGHAQSSAFGHIRRSHSGASASNLSTNGDDSDEDGSSIMGRAANIANTAKGLIGALWYGAHGEPGTGAAPGTASRHRRHQSQG